MRITIDTSKPCQGLEDIGEHVWGALGVLPEPGGGFFTYRACLFCGYPNPEDLEVADDPPSVE